MTDRWVILAGTSMSASVLAVTGYRPWAFAVVLVGLFLAARFGGHRPAEFDRLFSPDLRRQLLERAGGRCTYCGVPIHYASDCRRGGCDDCYEADHVEAWADGGATTLANGVAACRRCNRAKSARPVDEFIADPDRDDEPGWSPGG